MGTSATPTRVYLEVAPRRTFAVALDWPGWARSGRTAEAALTALDDYQARYAKVVARTAVDFPPGAGGEFSVAEELPGSATTEFGAPAAFATGDDKPWATGEAARTAGLLRACWDELDDVAADSPAELRKGPRGGGRDRDKMIDHVLDAEVAYARKIGWKERRSLDDRAAIEALRTHMLAVLTGETAPNVTVAKPWPLRYAARRIAWHVLDHAWEMEDRRT